jgi:hypothetical protein
MNPLAQGFAVGRVVLGATALVAPGPVSKAFGLGEGPSARVAGRYLGGRDLATGVGMLLAGRHGTARGWFEAAALIDFIDAGATVLAASTGAMPKGRAALVTLLAAGSGAVALALARTADEPDELPSYDAD